MLEFQDMQGDIVIIDMLGRDNMCHESDVVSFCSRSNQMMTAS